MWRQTTLLGLMDGRGEYKSGPLHIKSDGVRPYTCVCVCKWKKKKSLFGRRALSHVRRLGLIPQQNEAHKVLATVKADDYVTIRFFAVLLYHNILYNLLARLNRVFINAYIFIYGLIFSFFKCEMSYLFSFRMYGQWLFFYVFLFKILKFVKFRYFLAPYVEKRLWFDILIFKRSSWFLFRILMAYIFLKI